MGVKVNEDIGHFFQMKKGLRQGDPLSSSLQPSGRHVSNSDHKG